MQLIKFFRKQSNKYFFIYKKNRMKTSLMEQPESLYYDKNVLISELYLKIFKYYLPLATSKTIFFKEISYIIYHRGCSIDVIWGASSDKLNDWFPFDGKRANKKGYFEVVLKERNIRPCFSPIDPERAFEILWMNHSNKETEKKEQKLKQSQGVILLSAKEQDLHNPINNQREQIIIESKFTLPIQDHLTIAQMRKQMMIQREPFQDLTNFSLNNHKLFTKKDGERFSPVKYLQFEEESVDEYSSQKENHELIDELDFEDLE